MHMLTGAFSQKVPSGFWVAVDSETGVFGLDQPLVSRLQPALGIVAPLLLVKKLAELFFMHVWSRGCGMRGGMDMVRAMAVHDENCNDPVFLVDQASRISA